MEISEAISVVAGKCPSCGWVDSLEEKYNMERLTMPDEIIEGGLRRPVVNAGAVKQQAMTLYWRLKKYEDTGLTPEEIMGGKMLSGWIPVDERLPRTEDGYAYVMVCMDDEFVATTDYTDGDGFSLWAESGEVIAWMPLPEPYRVGEN